MIWGIALGICVSGLIALLVWVILDGSLPCEQMKLFGKFDTWTDDFWSRFIVTAIIVVGIVLGGIAGVSVTNADYRSFIEQYKTTQYIYSSALENENMSGYERFELVKMANEYSVSLANRKINAYQWWNVGLDSDIKTELMTLEIIE